MNYLATFDENGCRTGSYIEGIHKNIPVDAIAISEEEQNLYMTNLYFRNSEGVPELIQPNVEEQTPEEFRQIAYFTEENIEWNGNLITVDEANNILLDYFAEGDAEKYEAIRVLIIAEKKRIRDRYPNIA